MNNKSVPVRRSGRPAPFASDLSRHPSLVRALLDNPGREFTIRELSIESGTAYATAWRLVRLLRTLGALRERRVGASRAVSLNPRSPLLQHLRRLVALDLDPHREAARRFARLAARTAEVRQVILFGSVARGTARPSSDVDLAVVLDRRTDETLAALDHAATRVQDETGLRVVPIPVSMGDLRRETRLAQELRGGEVLYRRPG